MVYLPLDIVESKRAEIEKFSSHKKYVIHDIEAEWKKNKNKDDVTIDKMSKKIFRRLDELYFGGVLHESTVIRTPRIYTGPDGTGSTMKTRVEYKNNDEEEVVKNEIIVKWDEFSDNTCDDHLESLIGSVLHEMVHCHWYVNRPLDKNSHNKEPYSVEFYHDIWFINQHLKISYESALGDYEGPKSALKKRFPIPLRLAPVPSFDRGDR